MKLSTHKDLDGFLDYIALVPENSTEKAQLNKISHATSSKIMIQDLSVPELHFSVEIEIKLKTKY